MTSRERLCAAMRRQDTDYLPCSLYFNNNLVVGRYNCSRPADRAALAKELGTDPFVGVGMPNTLHPDVLVRNWETRVAGEEYPILWQSWDTPEGQLTQAVRKTPAGSAWRRIHWSDNSASSLYKPLIEKHGDIALCRWIIQPSTDDQYAAWIDSRSDTFAFAESEDLPVVATYGEGLATLLFMIGAERAVWLAVDDPEGFEELAEIMHRRDMRNIELAARGRIDILKRFGGYEMCNFYNPEIFRRVCLPRLKREVEYAHALGLLIFYRIVTGMEPLLEDIADIGFDCIEGGEPRLSRCSLEMWHGAFSGRSASWTGISAPALLGGHDPGAVRKEVRHCAEVFGKQGFILGVTNSIRNHFPWENTLAMVDEWKRIR